MRSWSITCWLVVRLVFHFLGLFSLVKPLQVAHDRRRYPWCNQLPFSSFLLLSGAKCEANTFDGERCMYGSLNDSVRRTLKDYKCVSVRAMQREGFDYCLHMWGAEGNACKYSIPFVFLQRNRLVMSRSNLVHLTRTVPHICATGCWNRVNTAMSSSWSMDKYSQLTDVSWALAPNTLLACLKPNGARRNWSPSNTLW